MRLRRTGSGPVRYDQVLDPLRSAYDAGAAERDMRVKADWKVDERAAFLDRLHAARARTLLEVGSGTGQDSAYFAAEGLEVTAVDLSPAMVERTRAKGVSAYVRDVLNLGFPADSFDAAYSMNALLHVPNADLAEALRAVRTVLKPGGLFFVGVFGGEADGGHRDRRPARPAAVLRLPHRPGPAQVRRRAVRHPGLPRLRRRRRPLPVAHPGTPVTP